MGPQPVSRQLHTAGILLYLSVGVFIRRSILQEKERRHLEDLDMFKSSWAEHLVLFASYSHIILLTSFHCLLLGLLSVLV